ncbi:MAG: exodeoxyribonuclease VII large subunit [Patescibacteria group bacterium]
MDRKILTVSEVNFVARRTLEEITVWVEGEVDEYEPNYKSAVYLKLKDGFSVLPALFWKSTDVSYFPKNGDRVRVFGTLTIYEKTGKYQMLISKIEEVGIGDLLKRREELRRRLLEEGYFDDSIKRQIPDLPVRIGLVTSKRGAAIKDFLTNVVKNFEGLEIVFVDSLVQGDSAAKSICQAFEALAKHSLDVVVLTRGGGAIEDLMCFNTEEVVRAIRACKFPVISAVGHEVDYTLSDLASDLRVSTPTKAAEFLSLKFLQYKTDLESFLERLHFAYQRMEMGFMQELDLYESTLKRAYASYQNLDVELSSIRKLMQTSVEQIFEKQGLILAALTQSLNALSPTKVLERGYGIVFTSSGNILKSIKKLAVDDKVYVKLSDGSFESKILKVTND